MRAPLETRSLSYDCPGITTPASADWLTAPPRYRRFETTLPLRRRDWPAVCQNVLTWTVKTRSGFDVGGTPGAPVRVGERVWVTAHVGPVRIHEPVEIVAVVATDDRCGFAYGTLTGHPVSGEEAYIASRARDGEISLTLRSVTAAPSGPWRLAFPMALVAQRFYRRRYGNALRA